MNRPHLRSFRWGIVVLAAGVASSCGEASNLPPGFSLDGEGPPVLRFLGQLESLEGTPLAKRAGVLRRRLASCRRIQGHTEDLRNLAAALDCADEGAASPIESSLGKGQVVWSLEIEAGHHLTGEARFGDDGSVTLSAEMPVLPRKDLLALLLPGADEPGPTLLSRRDALLQGRFKADQGLDPSRFLPEDEQVEGLFQLKSQILTDLLLEGSWELALYEPAEGDLMPPLALAVGFTQKKAAETAWNAYLREVEKAWGFVPVPLSLDRYDGACLNEIRVLPELAPCYLVTDGALVLGWNRESLQKAFGGEPSDELADHSRLVVELAALPGADSRLTASLRERLGVSEDSPTPVEYPWKRLVLAGRREGSRYLLEGRLEPGE